MNCEGEQDSTPEVKASCLGEEHPQIKILGPKGWGLGVRLTTSPCEKAIVVSAQEKKFGQNYRQRPGKKKANYFGFYTWNVRSHYTPGALQILTNILEEYNVDIMALQEIRWAGKRIWEKQKYRIYSSCNTNEHIFLTGFIVGDRIKRLIMDFKAVNERVCKIRTKGNF